MIKIMESGNFLKFKDEAGNFFLLKSMLFMSLLFFVVLFFTFNGEAIIIETNGSIRSQDYNGTGGRHNLRVLGVHDDVPGAVVIVPFICGKDANNNLDTLWAISNTSDEFDINLKYTIYNKEKNEILTNTVEINKKGVINASCKNLLSLLLNNQRTNFEQTISNKVYYVGYVIYNNYLNKDNNIIGWQYIVDLPNGFAAGMNSYVLQNGINSSLCEGTGDEITEYTCSSASYLYPRFFIMNNLSDTYNLWIILAGQVDMGRQMYGTICNENRNCINTVIPIPYSLNVINVGNYIPSGLFSQGEIKSGYGNFEIVPYNHADTLIGWSYQRIMSTSNSLSWSAIHPIHKNY